MLFYQNIHKDSFENRVKYADFSGKFNFADLEKFEYFAGI